MTALTHPLTANRWSVADEAEFGTVRLSHLHQLECAGLAIKTIARLVGNSVLEPGASNATPLDAQSIAHLMGGVESICEHLAAMSEAMRAESSRHEEPNAYHTLRERAPASLYVA